MVYDPLAEALALVRTSEFVTVSTLGEEGFPETRIMFNLKSEQAAPLMPSGHLCEPFSGSEGDFRSFIGTNTSSKKTMQVRRDARACLYYADTSNYRGLSVVGNLLECREISIKKALWKEGWERYYPQGVGDPDFAVFAFAPLRVRFYHGLHVYELPPSASKENHVPA